MKSRIPPEVYELIVARAYGCCERCKRPLWFTGSQVHHRRGKKHNTPADLVVLCHRSATMGCAHEIECKNRKQAELDGWIVRRHSITDCESVPVTDLDGRSWLLKTDGSREEV